jgi:hypothetical protein
LADDLRGPVPGRRIDPEYCRRKAALCRELARKPGHRTHAKVLLKLAKRFEQRAGWRDE